MATDREQATACLTALAEDGRTQLPLEDVWPRSVAAVAEGVDHLAAACLHAPAELVVEEGRRPFEVPGGFKPAQPQAGKCQSPMV